MLIPQVTRRFGGSSGDIITIPSWAAAETLSTWTALALVRPTALTSGFPIIQKGLRGSGAAGKMRFRVVTDAANGAFRVDVDAATTDMQYKAVAVMRQHEWQWVAAAVDLNAGSGDRARLYWKLDTSPVFRRLGLSAAATEPAGGFVSDAGEDLTLGSGVSTGTPFQGDIAAIAISSVRLAHAELEAFCHLGIARGVLGVWYPGMGGATVYDATGGGKHGTPSTGLPVVAG